LFGYFCIAILNRIQLKECQKGVPGKEVHRGKKVVGVKWFRSTMDSISDSDSEDVGSIPPGTTNKTDRSEEDLSSICSGLPRYRRDAIADLLRGRNWSGNWILWKNPLSQFQGK
jgi:hypothetical protein